MNPYKNENSLKKIFSNKSQSISPNISVLYIKLFHKIFDSINISLLILIFTLSFLSFNSQKKWTNTFKNLSKIRLINNNLIDYISKTEELYINELESLNTVKKTTPKDLIYLVKQIPNKKGQLFNKKIRIINEGLKDSRYQKGY